MNMRCEMQQSTLSHEIMLHQCTIGSDSVSTVCLCVLNTLEWIQLLEFVVWSVSGDSGMSGFPPRGFILWVFLGTNGGDFILSKSS